MIDQPSPEIPLSGSPPRTPPWGQEVVRLSPELADRIEARPGARQEAVLVLGAGGAFAPDLLHALLREGSAAVIGLDLQLSYRVEGVIYRAVDLCDESALRAFLLELGSILEARGLALGTVYDLATTQTSPRGDRSRERLSAGKEGLLRALCELPGDVRLFFMSTAEVYGAPEGAPYREDHIQQPFNPYGQQKRREEKLILSAHQRPTRGGHLKTVALRCWTICMVNMDEEGRILSTRNYNDPFIAIAHRLSDAGLRVPVVDPDLRCQFHLSEEVAEACVRLGGARADAPTWNGTAYNCIGAPSTHGELRDICFEVFSETPSRSPWWAPMARILLARGRLPRPLLARLALTLERAGGLLGARALAGRLPFLYRSTDIDSSRLTRELGDQLHRAEGSPSQEAVRRLALGIRNGGGDALSIRRYRSY